MDIEEITHQYNIIHDSYSKSEDNYFRQYILWPAAEKYLNISYERVGLYLGCGSGKIIPRLVQQGAELIAIDVSEEMLNQAKHNLAKYPHLQKNVKFELKNCFKMEYGAENLDFIYVPFVSSYTSNKAEIQQMFKRWYSALKSTGRGLLVCGAERNAQDYTGGPKNGGSILPGQKAEDGCQISVNLYTIDGKVIEKPIKVFYWSPNTFVTLLEQAGFKVTVIDQFAEISNDGFKQLGDEYWQEFKKEKPLLTYLLFEKL